MRTKKTGAGRLPYILRGHKTPPRHLTILFDHRPSAYILLPSCFGFQFFELAASKGNCNIPLNEPRLAQAAMDAATVAAGRLKPHYKFDNSNTSEPGVSSTGNRKLSSGETPLHRHESHFIEGEPPRKMQRLCTPAVNNRETIAPVRLPDPNDRQPSFVPFTPRFTAGVAPLPAMTPHTASRQLSSVLGICEQTATPAAGSRNPFAASHMGTQMMDAQMPVTTAPVPVQMGVFGAPPQQLAPVAIPTLESPPVTEAAPVSNVSQDPAAVSESNVKAAGVTKQSGEDAEVSPTSHVPAAPSCATGEEVKEENMTDSKQFATSEPAPTSSVPLLGTNQSPRLRPLSFSGFEEASMRSDGGPAEQESNANLSDSGQNGLDEKPADQKPGSRPKPNLRVQIPNANRDDIIGTPSGLNSLTTPSSGDENVAVANNGNIPSLPRLNMASPMGSWNPWNSLSGAEQVGPVPLTPFLNIDNLGAQFAGSSPSALPSPTNAGLIPLTPRGFGVESLLSARAAPQFHGLSSRGPFDDRNNSADPRRPFW